LRGVLEIVLPLKGLNRHVTDQIAKIRFIYSLVGLLMLGGYTFSIHRLKLSERNLTLRSNELEIANQKLKDISELDALTQIPNRRSYDARIASEVSAAKHSESSLSMLLIDIDYFKSYNDGYGHEQGDEALIQVVNIARDCMLRETDFLTRYGGEEFIVLLPFTDVEGAFSIAENIRVKIETAAIPHEFARQNDCVTVSIGIAAQSASDIDAGDLFRSADAALYNAKANGRNRCEVYRKK
jgi:diguanylate cyclase (GGDEF)-like protein